MKNPTNIKKLEILGRTVKIEFTSNEIGGEEGTLGVCYFDDQLIRIAKNKKLLEAPYPVRPRRLDDLWITTLHELIHYALFSLDYKELSEDEMFVERFSEVLYQILKQIFKK